MSKEKAEFLVKILKSIKDNNVRNYEGIRFINADFLELKLHQHFMKEYNIDFKSLLKEIK